LTVADAKRAIELARPRLREVTVGGKRYWRGASGQAGPARGPGGPLLANDGELVVAYGDRSASIDASRLKNIGSWAMAIANNLIAVDGRAVGGWRRIVEKKAVVVGRLVRRALDAGGGAGRRGA